MALIERSAPAKVKKAFLKSLELADDASPPGDDPDSEGGDGGGSGPGGDGSGGSLPVPLIVTLPIFVLGLRPLARGIVAGGAKRAGWQFLKMDSKGVITFGETTEFGAASSEITRSRGPSWTKAYRYYDEAQKVQKLLENAYEPFSLRIPGLQIDAFWMRRKSADDFLEQLDEDVIVPFLTSSPKLAVKLWFSMREFISIAQPLAQKQLSAPPPPID